jgi:hypothetical protein
VKIVLAILLMTTLCFDVSIYADDEDTFGWNEKWECGKKAYIPKQIISGISQFDGYKGDTHIPPFLIGTLPNPYFGTLLFVKNGSNWESYPIADGHGVVGMYLIPNGKSLILFTMFQCEGPGSSFTITQSDNSFSSLRCYEINFPPELNKPRWANEYLELHDFNIYRNGKGAMVALTRVVRQGVSQVWWYRYNIKNGGVAWSRPTRLKKKPKPVSGVYSKSPNADVSTLVEELLHHANSDALPATSNNPGTKNCAKW